MDKRKRGSALFSNDGRKTEDGRNDGDSGELEGEDGQELDLFGDEDDEIFSRISDDCIIIEEGNEQEQPQSSTSHQVGRPSTLAHISNFGTPAPNSRLLEKLPDFDEESGSSWIYPLNFPMRGYQYSMVENSLFKNTLISLPTGLGKTFIAAVVMYNFYRWYPTCKVVFMAPTKPLVAQQVEACFNIMGIRQIDISQMTGTLTPEKRIEQWTEKRVFFLTPQVLTNDLSRGTCPAKLIRCLVLDEAHRALGNHAYCQVVRGLKEHGHDFRILALSATPGSDMNAVQQVLTNLSISHVELRNEDSPDIQEYTFQRSIEKIVVPLGQELTSLKERYLKVLRVYVNKLIEMKALYTRDETTLTKFQLLKSRDCFRQNPPSDLPRNKFGVVEGLFALCMTLYHAYELMMQHGTRSFYRFLKETLSNDKSYFFARGELSKNRLFQTIMKDLSEKFETDSVPHSLQDPSALFNQIGSPPRGSKVPCKTPYIFSHPKMAKLLSIVLEHHQKSAKEEKSTRVMIFSQYRDSVLEITEMLQQHYPVVKAMSFVGHRNANQGGKGFSQKKQLQVVSEFRQGGYNTLVSTCVGEEGLDIGDVDLIICYDAPKSPIRLVQRMGRTGRKREGRIVVLLTEGKEEQSYNSSQYQKKAINNALGDTQRLIRYLNPNSPRMVPRGMSPSCIKLHMKVDSWETKTKGHKYSTKGSGCLQSMLSKAGSASSKKSNSREALMTQEEWQWYRNIEVPQEEVRTLPPPSLMCLDASKNESDPDRNINLGSYQPWQSLAQTTHLVGHSPSTLHLVELTEFIHLQQHYDPSEDPYGLEMAAFLDKEYVEDGERNEQHSPDYKDFKKTPSRHLPAASQEDEKVKKVKRKLNCDVNKRKKPKTIQSSLITDMFKRMTQSQNDRQDTHQKRTEDVKATEKKQDMVPSQTCNENDAENDDVRDNLDFEKTGNDDLDNNVTCLMDNHVDSGKLSSAVTGGSQKNKRKQSAGTADQGKNNRLDQVPSARAQEERQKRFKEHLFLPVPSGGFSPFDILTPPQFTDFESDNEVEEPNSPSEVIDFCSEWLAEKLRKISNEGGNSSAPPHPSSPSKSTISEKGNGSEIGENNNVIGNAVMLALDNCEKQEENSTSLFSIGEISPVIGKSLCTKNKIIGKVSGNNSNSFGCSKDVGGFMDLSTIDVSPLLSKKNTLHCSSTPKVVSKCLFEKVNPDLSVIEEISPVPKKNHATDTATPNLEYSSIALGMGMVGNECQKKTNKLSTTFNRQRKFKSKLSLFARPKVPESFPENSTEANISSDLLHPKGNGKSLKNKLLYATEVKGEEVPCESNRTETDQTKPNNKLRKVRNLEFSLNNTAEHSDKSGFLFEDLQQIDFRVQKPSWEMEKGVYSISHSSISYSAKHSPHPYCKPGREDKLDVKMSGAISGEKGHHCVSKCAEMGSENNKITHEVTVSNSPATVEDSSLFACIEEDEINEVKSSVIKKHDNSSSGLSVTQVLNYVNEKFGHNNSRNASTISTFPKSSQNNSRNLQENARLSTDHSTRKCSLSLSKKSHQESKVEKSDAHIDSEAPGASTTALLSTSQRKSLSRAELYPPAKTNQLIHKETTAGQIKTQEEPIEKNVVSCNQEKVGMSGSFAANTDFEFLDMSYIDDMELENVAGVNNSGSMHPSLAKVDDQGNRTHEKSRDLFSTTSLSSSKLSGGKECSKLMSPTQEETQLLIKRKRKMYNVLDSDHENSFLSTDSDKDTSKTSATSESRRTSRDSTCVTAPLRKAVADHLKCHVDDDDDDRDFVEVIGQHQPKKNKQENLSRKKKHKRLVYLDDEAELSKDGAFVSSDELDDDDDEERESDHNFVDDGTYLSQDIAQDMKAVYLKSIVSPVRARVPLRLPPPRKYIHDSEDGEGAEEQTEDSFVVDNSFVEYETEYAGETMLAEDPIIQQVLQDQIDTEKTEKAAAGNKAKRKRIILNESSSDEDVGRDKKRKQAPVKTESSCMENILFLNQDKSSLVESYTKNTALTGETKNTPSCSDKQDCEIIREVKHSVVKQLGQSTKLCNEKLSTNMRREHALPPKSTRPQNSESRIIENSFVKPITSKSSSAAIAGDQQVSQSLGDDGGGGKQRLEASSSGGGGGGKLNILSWQIVQSDGPPKEVRQSNVLPKELHQSNVPPKELHQSHVLPKELHQSNVPPKELHQSHVLPKKPHQSNVPPKELDQSNVLPKELHQSNVLPKDNNKKDLDQGLDISLIAGTPPSPFASSVAGSQTTSLMSPQLNATNTFFVAAAPFNKSLSESQSMVTSTYQEAVGVLVDSSQVQSGGNVLSHLRLHYGAHTAVVQLTHAHYAVSTRMAVARVSLVVFSSGQYRNKLVQRVQGMLELYERPVIIVESEVVKGGSLASHKAHGRSRYLDTIVCACTQVTRLKVLYSKGQEETSYLLWQLLLLEKTKGFKIPVEPPMNKKRQQMANFYRTLPSIGYPTAVSLAQNFSTIKEFLKSSAECIQKNGGMSLQKAASLKEYLTKQFREDMMP